MQTRKKKLSDTLMAQTWIYLITGKSLNYLPSLHFMLPTPRLSQPRISYSRRKSLTRYEIDTKPQRIPSTRDSAFQ